MAARSKAIPERFALTARIRSSDLSYHIAQSQGHEFREILAFEMLATIETIHPKFKRHLGEDLHVSLTGSGRVSHNAYGENDANAIYMIDLRAQSRYLSGVIPSDTIFALPALIEAGHIGYLVIDFEPPRQGRGLVRSIDFVSETRLSDYRP